METKNEYLGFVKLVRSSQVEHLIAKRPTAFCLLAIIAYRARRTNERHFDDLQIGEAYIGDYKSYGVTEAKYRKDKDFLEKYGLVTFKPTTKGTIARIADTSIFDINAEEITSKQTNESQSDNARQTTNKNDKNDNNVKKHDFSLNIKNPILQDPDFLRLKEIYHSDDDVAVRAKMSLQPALDAKYPVWKYGSQWVEAKESLRTS